MPLLRNIGSPVGSSGYPLVGNESWSSDEYNIELSSPTRAVATYDRMRKSDGKVRASLNNIVHTIKSAQWRIDPAEDEPTGEADAEFVRSVLMPGEAYGYSGHNSWQQSLAGTLMCIPFGFSVQEKVLGYREDDGKQVVAALELRHPRSIRHFNLSKSGISRLESVTQYAQSRSGGLEDKTMMAKNLVVTTYNREGDNYWGESILRPAHFHWKRKREILKWDVIFKERAGGILYAQAKEGQRPSDPQIAAAKQLLRNFRVSAEMGLYFPNNIDLHALFPTGDGAKYIESVRYDDEQIEQCMFSAFQSLGTGQKGARSVGEIQLEFMLMAYQGVAKMIEDSYGEQYIVGQVRMNLGERKKYPRLVCENFMQMKPDRLALVMKPLIDCGLIRIDTPLRVVFRDKLSLPPEDPATLEDRPSAPTAADPNAPGAAPSGQAGKPPAKKPAEDEPKKARMVKRSYFTPSFWREAFPHETHVDWEGTARYLDDEPTRIWHRIIAPARKKMAVAIAEHFATAGDMTQARRTYDVPGEKRLAGQVGDALLKVYARGRASVLEDRARQLTVAKMAKAEDDEEEWDVEPTDAQEHDINWLAAGFISVMIGAMVQRAIEAGQVSRDARRSAAEQQMDIERAIIELSEDVQIANLEGRTARAYANGRVQQGLAMRDAISAVFYSARMDSGTCDPCWAMDGEEVDFDTYESIIPNPECHGLDRCRCEPVFVFKAVDLPEAA